MRTLYSVAIAAIALGAFAVSSAGAQTTRSSHTKTFGYQDADTGNFHPLPQLDPEVTSTTAPTTGKYVLTFKVKVESSFPSGTQIGCEVTITEITILINTTTPATTESSFSEIGTGTVAAGGVGSIETCTVSIPYSWIIPPTPKAGKSTTTVVGAYIVTAVNLPASGTATQPSEHYRASESQLPIPNTLPASGATTSATVNAVL